MLVPVLALFALVGCSNGRGSVGSAEAQEPPPEAPPTLPQFTVGGAVTGLAGSGLVLQNSGADQFEVAADGAFTFSTPLDDGTAYSISILSQPLDPEQTCTVSEGTGTIDGANVTNVSVTCVTAGQSLFTLGGTVSGLLGTGLVLQNNGGEQLSIGGDGDFAFATPLASGAPYNVTIAAQPDVPVQTCTIANAAGAIDESNVADITVTCATDVFNVGGSVNGLTGSGLILQLNAANDRAITGDGRYEFPIALPSGTAYVVSVLAQPNNPTQECTLENASGAIADSSIENVDVTCVGAAFTVGGTVAGLEGNGLTLQLNGGDDLAIASNGRFTFATSRESGSTYDVTVSAQPTDPSQSCTVADASGVVGAGDVRNVRVTCATNTYSISGEVNGLLGAGLVLENSGDRIEIESDGQFTFPTEVASGGSYEIAVREQPTGPTQSCTITNGAGTIVDADIANVQVSCTTSQFLVGGTVGGLAGSGLVLRNNGADDLTVDSDGSFTFPTALASGGSYDVTIAAHPTSPTQICTLSNASGVVADRDVASIQVSCVTTEFTLGGTVSGLLGSGLVLRNNGADDVAIAADGAFTFADSLLSGTPYNVAVATPPSSPTQECAIANGTGTITDANVTNVAVSCVTSTFTISVEVSGLFGLDLEVTNNGTDTLNIDFSGTHTFALPVASGDTYNVTVTGQPSISFQTCSVTDGAGTVVDQNVTVAVTCEF